MESVGRVSESLAGGEGKMNGLWVEQTLRDRRGARKRDQVGTQVRVYAGRCRQLGHPQPSSALVFKWPDTSSPAAQGGQ